MEFEGVGSIAMGDLIIEFMGQIDDVYGLEWAFFNTNPTSVAEIFIDLCFFLIIKNNAFQACEIDWAVFNAFKTASLGFTIFQGDYC